MNQMLIAGTAMRELNAEEVTKINGGIISTSLMASIGISVGIALLSAGAAVGQYLHEQ